MLFTERFWSCKKINIAIFGHGLVGGTLINQILGQQLSKKKRYQAECFAIANSKMCLIKQVSANWKNEIQTNGSSYTIDDIIAYATDIIENLIAIDNTIIRL
jgi:homoserine dehydrogenase